VSTVARRVKRKLVMISSVARQYDIHPQTLRMYEREGLITPQRSDGNTRLYDEESIQRLEAILTLTRDMGVNLAGVEVILRLREQLEELAAERDRLREVVERQSRERASGILRQHALVRVKAGPLVKRERKG
jgi:MerR family transcriptional regulator, heat shock protein HspR